MPRNVDEIVVGANGGVFVAPDGTPLPDTIGDAKVFVLPSAV